MSSPPTGTVAFLFTDLEGSTRMWERDSRAMSEALARHDEILKGAIEERGGYVFKTVGDAFCSAFRTTPDALEAALVAQRALLGEESEKAGPLRVRMALHVGAAEERDGDYFGPPLNRAARLLSAAYGGQVLLSLPTQELVRDRLPPDVELWDLGERRLKDLFRPERVFQLVAPGLPSEFPPLRTLEVHPNNLPLQPTPLVGREREVGEVLERVRSEGTRLLTLTGPGGTGKTRLALQAGADLLDDFEDGVFFVPLATVTDPELVPSAIAGPLGVRESGDRPLTESLEGHLKEKHLLLILDNFEQVLEGASVVGELVAACPNLEVLATSRAPLRLYGEQEYPVLALALPDTRVLPPLQVLTQYEAVRLFVERARAVKPDFSITNDSAPAVAEICARLDGLPLAIELAAARVRILPPSKMLRRLTDRLKLLKGGARDLPTRQRTLRSTIDWSYQLLKEEYRTLFGRLSVFAGGRTLEAIEEICDPEGGLDALEGVESLVEKSLLRQEEGVGGEPRFYMLETVHEYAREKLKESGEAEVIKRAHAMFFLALAEEANAELKGPKQLEWIERLEAEHDNMRAALAWTLQSGEAVLALGLGGALWWFWDMRGHFSEGSRWLEEALAMNDRGSLESRAMALAGVGRLAHRQSDLDRAEEACEEGLKLLELTEEEGGEARVHLCWTSGLTALLQRNDPERAKGFLEAGLALSRQQGLEWGVAGSLINLAIASYLRGDHERSRQQLEESLALFRELGDEYGASFSLMTLGGQALAEGAFVRSASYSEESAAIFRKLGARGELAFALLNQGSAMLDEDPQKAQTALSEALTLSLEVRDVDNTIACLEAFACVASRRAEAHRAATLFGAAEGLREASGFPSQPDDKARVDSYLSAIRSRVEQGAWIEAWKVGRAMTLTEAVAYALEKDEVGV